MNKLSEIKNRKYSGYIWKSDSKEPEVYNNEEVDFSIINVNPFIIEGLLYCKDDNISLTIKHTGKYHINEIDLNNLPKGAVLEGYSDVDKKEKLNYLPHRLKDDKKGIDVDKVCFKQLWVTEEDENCENMLVLKMKALVFTGFKLKN